MWFFSSPQIIFGEGALSYLEGISGKRACIVTDETLVKLGYTKQLRDILALTGMEIEIFSAVEPDPSTQTVQRGAEVLARFQPDWIIALGGGSVMDSAKAMWVLYERPDLTPESINPIEHLGLGQKAHLIAIPTTTGTGSEATWAVVLTDTVERRKLALGSRENLPTIAILDPELVRQLPARLTADTGLDALTHAIEGYTTTWHNDFTDGLCLQAARLVFDYLPCVFADGSDVEARTHLQNAATIAGLGFGNAMAGLAHGMGHALGGVFHVPHGRAVALFLPYTLEYGANGQQRGVGAETRCGSLARFLDLPACDDIAGALALARAIRELEQPLGQPLTIADYGIGRADFERELDLLVSNALNDSQTIMGPRVPESDALRQLFLAAFTGNPIDF